VFWRGSFEAYIDLCGGLNRLTIALLSSELSCFFLTVQLVIVLVQFINIADGTMSVGTYWIISAKPVKKTEPDSRKAS
jgi:hypothetical protein